MGGPSSSSSSSSSGEEDGPAEWREAVESIAATTTFGFSNGFANGSTSNATTSAKPVSHSTSNTEYDSDEEQQRNPQKLKHYQIKAQKLLDGILEKSLEMVRDPAVHILDNGHVKNEGIVRLFKNSPPGIVFDHIDELKGPTKKPRILPGKEIDMKSKKFKQQLRSVLVDGADILAAARDACQKSSARQEAKDAAAKAKAKKEEERVAELKRIRGERWLPSIAREMQLKRNAVQ
ncbi:Ribose-5-phosphate isomerase A [Melia azedarach]|uniref:Ribose-5-phosphate isomerase A n=1 Tax=Melia azedarach TaxID=155640 RepID=A0ACC1XT99_MELAZ|nr:Ribose-5-phosphate isomerase A [Melia azedarach]